MNNNNNYIPVGHIFQKKSNQHVFQFLDKNENAYILIFFKDEDPWQIAGSFGSTANKKSPLNLDYIDQLQWALDQIKPLTSHIKGLSSDSRFQSPIVVDL